MEFKNLFNKINFNKKGKDNNKSNISEIDNITERGKEKTYNSRQNKTNFKIKFKRFYNKLKKIPYFKISKYSIYGINVILFMYISFTLININIVKGNQDTNIINNIKDEIKNNSKNSKKDDILKRITEKKFNNKIKEKHIQESTILIREDKLQFNN